MSNELTEVWQFETVNEVISFQNAQNVELISVEPFLPSDISVSTTSVGGNINFIITGFYGEDLAVDHQFMVRTGDSFVTYTSYNNLISSKFDNIIKFKPDPSHNKIISYTLSVQDSITQAVTQNTYTQYVHMDHSRWNERLKAALKFENYPSIGD